jgi:hypothetical protein
VTSSPSSLFVCVLVAASFVAISGCGGSSSHSVTRSEFVSATASSGLGPLKILDNGIALAKLGRSLQQPDVVRNGGDETLVVSAGTHDPRSARLYGVRFKDSIKARDAEQHYGTGADVRVCNVVLMSAASAGSADRHRFDRLVSTLRKRC